MNKKILIITDDADDSSNLVINWLLYFKADFIRLNGKVDFEVISITIENSRIKLLLKSQSTIINLDEISVFWYRRGNISMLTDEMDNPFVNYCKIENNALLEFIITKLDEKQMVNGYSHTDINKCQQLELAIKTNLKIPNTLITTSKKNLTSFLDTNKTIITKSIHAQIPIEIAGISNFLYTSDFNTTDVSNCSDYFFPTKFQTKIEKLFELRIFYLDRKFYAMAIFSQTNSRTKTDFRNYDRKDPNRNIPFKLPKQIKSKLTTIMKKLKLASGSIDMIVDKDGEYIFLEVNPIGQFGMVSIPCNYGIENIIAKKLIEY